ncbi:MAG: hypothetical protein OXF02_00625 [Simkaniaceae bacterium]|nr:hypothetical protein [Simkaniaceae bacterium]
MRTVIVASVERVENSQQSTQRTVWRLFSIPAEMEVYPSPRLPCASKRRGETDLSQAVV